jgi:hypothetical protein
MFKAHANLAGMTLDMHERLRAKHPFVKPDSFYAVAAVAANELFALGHSSITCETFDAAMADLQRRWPTAFYTTPELEHLKHVPPPQPQVRTRRRRATFPQPKRRITHTPKENP